MRRGLLRSLRRSAAADATHRDDQVRLLQPSRVSAGDVQQDGGRVRRAAGRQALALLCAVDKQDRQRRDADARLLD